MARVDYLAPGVYIEEVSQANRTLTGIATSVAGFVGFTEDVRGGARLFQPTLVTSWNEYLDKFARPNSDGFTDFGAFLPFSVYGWFLNGGGRCWVTSVGTGLPGGEATTDSGTSVMSRSKKPALKFNLKDTEEATDSSALSATGLIAPEPLIVRIKEGQPKIQASTEEGVTSVPPNTGEYFDIEVRRGRQLLERFESLTMNPEAETAVADYVVTALADSEYLEIADLSSVGSPLARKPSNGIYEVSPPVEIPTLEEFTENLEGVRDDRSGIRGLFEIDEVTMISCPDMMKAYDAGLMDLDQLHGMMDIMISMCEGAASGDIPNPPNRMIVLDVPPDKLRPQDAAFWLNNEFNRRSSFAALYYPWVLAPNPRNGGRPIAIPPSGHVMGVWARTDATRGVHKAPANDTPRGVIGLTYNCNFREQELLNPIGINCIRSFPGRGIRIWGARTLAEANDLDWRYINVRRLISYIEKSIELGTQWVVFEPNDQDLWGRVRRVVGNFLTELWRTGALVGSTTSEAFYIRCDATNNPPESVMDGRLNVEVGVSAVRPAEFVVFRVTQMNPEGDFDGGATSEIEEINT